MPVFNPFLDKTASDWYLISSHFPGYRMLFNSPEFVFLFLPIAVIVYFLLNKMRLLYAGMVWLTLASFFFYAFWSPQYLILILGSIFVNYTIGTALARDRKEILRIPVSKKVLFFSGIVLNLGFLGYYKYTDFLITNANLLFGASFELQHIVLPLAISFFTFQQLAYLVDSYRGETREYDFVNYCLFVTFFPQLIAGPIVHHAEMMPQFRTLRAKIFDRENLARGLFIFSIGLFKKAVIADAFAVWANNGYDNAVALTLLNAWVVSLSYTFQLYFDFSGYTDMAMGAALMCNIRLPLNFNSPYKALSIQDFWRRWHMTLSRWLRDYLYIPLGGNRKGPGRTYLNLFLTFLLGGLWHGAGWTFVIWGALHGAATALHKFWQDAGMRMPRFFGWLCTFLFVHVAWVFFRAPDLPKAEDMLKGLVGMNGITGDAQEIYTALPETLVMLVVFFFIAVRSPNSMEWAARFRTTTRWALAGGLIAGVAILGMGRVTEFLYFNF